MPYKEKKNERENEIKIGDKIIITDNGETYTTYATWVVTNVDDPIKVAKYRYNSIPSNGMIGKVEYLVPHEYGHKMLAYIRGYLGYYLISTEGIEVYDGNCEIQEEYI